MKHYKEWHSCDRCGEKIKRTLIKEGKMYIKAETQDGCSFNDILDGFQFILYMKETKFELCPKCKKDFERFMKNENNRNE